MRILGIDPGSQVTGYGIIEKRGSHLIHIDNGGIFTSPTDSFPQKLKTIYEGVIQLIEQYSPNVAAVENIFYAKNVQSTVKLGHARGAAMVALTLKDLEVFEYTPLAIKQAIAGYGRATKEQIQKMVQHHLKLPEKTFYDSSDALAVALCHVQTNRFLKK